MATSTKTQVTELARIKALRDRLDKAEELVREYKVRPVVQMPGHWVVEGKKGPYLVNENCTCPDFVNRTDLLGVPCKHKLAAMFYEEQLKGPNYDPELDRKINELYN